MSVLLLWLDGPMQSWGHRSRFDDRDTGLEPTRSGVIGFISAAMGLARNADLSLFAGLRMGVRVERPGRVMLDFHTAEGAVKASGGPSNNPVVSRRYYLSDARFLIGLESDDQSLLRQIEAALRDPMWPLFLGRKSFPLSVPPCLPGDSVCSGSLEDALRDLELHHPLLGVPKDSVRIMVEADRPGDGATRNDVPLSFRPNDRRYGLRTVRSYTWPPQASSQEV